MKKGKRKEKSHFLKDIKEMKGEIKGVFLKNMDTPKNPLVVKEKKENVKKGERRDVGDGEERNFFCE